MKICYLCPDLGIPIDGHKGASTHIRNFVKALSDSGNELFVAASKMIAEGTLDVPFHLIKQPEMIEGIDPKRDPRLFRALRHLLYNGAIENTFKEVILPAKPDLIYERYSPFSAAGGILAGQYGIPHILEVNAPLADQGKRYRKQALQEASELMEITAFQKAGKIVTLTHELKEWLIGLGIEQDKVMVRPSGVDTSLFKPEGPSKKEHFQGKFVLGFVGSLKPWHDIGILIDTFPLLAEDKKCHLLVLGEGPMKKELEKLAERHPGRVTLAGAVDQSEIPSYIRAMDLCLAPYPDLDLFYFSPLKVYEYMAMGKPVLATRIGQLESLIEHGKTGWLASPENKEEWVAAVKMLKDHPDLRKKIGDEAVNNIQEKHTWEKRASFFMDRIKEELLTVC